MPWNMLRLVIPPIVLGSKKSGALSPTSRAVAMLPSQPSAPANSALKTERVCVLRSVYPSAHLLSSQDNASTTSLLYLSLEMPRMR